MKKSDLNLKSFFWSSIWVIFCVSLFIGYDGKFSSPASFIFGLFFYSSFMLWRTVLEKRVAPVELMFWLFHTNFLLLPALSQLINRNFYWGSFIYYSENSLFLGGFIIAFGILAFRIGLRYGRIKMKQTNIEWQKGHFFTRQIYVTWPVKFILSAIIIFLLAAIWSLGTELFTSPRMTKTMMVGSQAEMGLFLRLPQALGFGILIFLIAFWVQEWRLKRRKSLFIWLLFIASIGVNTIVNWPLSLSRFWFFGYCISIVWVIVPLCQVIWRGIFVIGMTVLQFSIFPLFSEITRGKGMIGTDLNSIRLYLQTGDFDGFQSIVNIYSYIQDNGYELGRNLLSVILFFIPRSLWNKAQPLGVAAADYMGYKYTNLSAPIYGEFYADFGLISLFVGMLFLGILVRIYDEYYNRLINIKLTGVGVVLSSVVAGYLIIILRGSLLGVLPSIATLFGFLLFLFWISGKRIRINTRIAS